MNEACPSQRHESAYPRSELFERRRWRMDDRAAVSFPIHARFYSLHAPLFAALGAAANCNPPNSLQQPSNPPVPAPISDSRLKAESVLR